MGQTRPTGLPPKRRCGIARMAALGDLASKILHQDFSRLEHRHETGTVLHEAWPSIDKLLEQSPYGQRERVLRPRRQEDFRRTLIDLARAYDRRGGAPVSLRPGDVPKTALRPLAPENPKRSTTSSRTDSRNGLTSTWPSNSFLSGMREVFDLGHHACALRIRTLPPFSA